MSDTTTAQNQARTGIKSAEFDLVKLLLEGRAFFALIAIIITFSMLSPVYFSVNNFLIMSSHVAIFGLLALGMLVVILTGGIDLSVGSTLALSGVVAGFLMQGVNLEMFGVILYPSVWVVVVLTCAVGAFVGLINGVLIAYFKVPAFVATLGLLYVARGVALLMTNGLTYNNLSGRPELGNTGFEWLGFQRLFGVPIGVIVLIAVAILCSLLLNRTALGRWIYSTGGNERAVDLAHPHPGPAGRDRAAVGQVPGGQGHGGDRQAVQRRRGPGQILVVRQRQQDVVDTAQPRPGVPDRGGDSGAVDRGVHDQLGPGQPVPGDPAG